jgi:hypothetical protein
VIFIPSRLADIYFAGLAGLLLSTSSAHPQKNDSRFFLLENFLFHLKTAILFFFWGGGGATVICTTTVTTTTTSSIELMGRRLDFGCLLYRADAT